MSGTTLVAGYRFATAILAAGTLVCTLAGCEREPGLGEVLGAGGAYYTSLPEEQDKAWEAYCDWALDRRGHVRVVVFYHRPTPGRGDLPAGGPRVRIKSGGRQDDAYASKIEFRCGTNLNGLWIDGVRKVVGKRVQVWYVSDTVRATRVALPPEEVERLVAILRRTWTEDGEILEYIETAILPRMPI